jgi:hypothetical protein
MKLFRGVTRTCALAAPLVGVLAWLLGCSPGSLSGEPVVKAVAAAAADEREQGIGDFPQLNAKRDWPWWRGPERNGAAASSASPPVKFGDKENVLWKTPIPGRGHSSPVVVGERIYLTTADESKQTQSVLALDRGSGELVWIKEISQGGFPERIHGKNTHATPTVACDGQRLFVTFFHHDAIELAALDLEGKVLWRKTAGPYRPSRYEYGYAPSPVLYRGTVIVVSEFDGESFLAAFRREDGGQAWRSPRPSNISYSSPAIAFVAGRDQLLLSGADQIASYDPNSGKLLWSTPGTTAATCGTMVWDGDIVFASGGYPKSETIAVRADGSGQVLWRNSQKCYEQSMLAHDGHLYALTDNGIAYCWRAADGKEMWKRRLAGPVSASPVLAGGHIYWANEAGTMYVFRPNPKQFELMEETRLGDEAFASPAVSGGQLFLRVAIRSGGRRQELLYCLGER